jgi:5'-3' exonuclease
MTNYILIDGSYFIFYRYFALLNWWKFSKKDLPLGIPIENEEFVAKFKKICVLKINELSSLLSIKDPIIIVGKDCKREKIWRMNIFPAYKGTRTNNGFEGGPFFKLAYDSIFKDAGVKHILKHKSLEADDCIAIAAKELVKNPNNTITIITSDTDYLQLIRPRIQIFNLKIKPIQTDKNSTGDSNKDLFIKIVKGDKSDNIPKIFNRCGKKKIDYYYANPSALFDELETLQLTENFHRNKTLIDFCNIPDDLVKEFTDECLSKLNIYE